jgi:hypothetical protein
MAASPKAPPEWYLDLEIDEVHVRGFCDSNGDGIGDLRGPTEKPGHIRDRGVGPHAPARRRARPLRPHAPTHSSMWLRLESR